MYAGLCSPGGWLGGGDFGTDLRFLRKEPPTQGDLTPLWRLKKQSPPLLAEQYRGRQAAFEKKMSAATGRICGSVNLERVKKLEYWTVSFLSTAGYSPVEHPQAHIDPNGSFCSGYLGPGKYYLYFTGWSRKGLVAGTYYPGVSERAKATVIPITAGQTVSAGSFKVPAAKTFSVRGVISANDDLTKFDNISLILIGLDGTPYMAWAHEPSALSSVPLFPKLKLFTVEGVLPGRYVALVSVPGKGWYMKKKEVNVATHSKFISLELVHKN
jgi:hypothetical protein